MHKVLKLNAIKNNINKQIDSYIDHLNPEEGGTILRIVEFFKKMKMTSYGMIGTFNRGSQRESYFFFQGMEIYLRDI